MKFQQKTRQSMQDRLIWLANQIGEMDAMSVFAELSKSCQQGRKAICKKFDQLYPAYSAG